LGCSARSFYSPQPMQPQRKTPARCAAQAVYDKMKFAERLTEPVQRPSAWPWLRCKGRNARTATLPGWHPWDSRLCPSPTVPSFYNYQQPWKARPICSKLPRPLPYHIQVRTPRPWILTLAVATQKTNTVLSARLNVSILGVYEPGAKQNGLFRVGFFPTTYLGDHASRNDGNWRHGRHEGQDRSAR